LAQEIPGLLLTSEIKRLCPLEAENSELKKIVADLLLDNELRKTLSAKTVKPARRVRWSVPSARHGNSVYGASVARCPLTARPTILFLSRRADTSYTDQRNR
jgi:hypothetical protein